MSPDSYQWGKMSRGQQYVMIGLDVLRAIATAGLGRVETMILFYVIENTWGRTGKRGRKGEPWPSTVPVEFTLASVAKQLRMTEREQKKSIYQAKSNLLKSRILTEVDGGLLVNKEAHEWIKADGSGPRLSTDFLAYAASAQRLTPVAFGRSETSMQSPERRFETSKVRFETDQRRFETDTLPLGGRFETSSHSRKQARGNPTGSNTNPTGSEHETVARGEVGSSRRKKRRRKLRVQTLPLSDGPTLAELPVVLDPETAPMHAWAMGETRSRELPAGNPEIADGVVRLYRDALAKGYPVLMVKKAIRDAAGEGRIRGLDRFTPYLAKILGNKTAVPSPIPTAPPGLVDTPSTAEAKRAKILADIEAKRARRRKESSHEG